MNGEESPGWGGDGIGRQESAGGARGVAGGGLGGAERREAERGCLFSPLFIPVQSVMRVEFLKLQGPVHKKTTTVNPTDSTRALLLGKK